MENKKGKQEMTGNANRDIKTFYDANKGRMTEEEIARSFVFEWETRRRTNGFNHPQQDNNQLVINL